MGFKDRVVEREPLIPCKSGYKEQEGRDKDKARTRNKAGARTRNSKRWYI